MILINGNFMCRNVTGIERLSWQILKNIDEMIESKEIPREARIALYVPANAADFHQIPAYKNLKLIQSDKPIHSFPVWDLFTFASACKKHKAVALNFSNTAPLGKRCGISYIHDIYAADFPQDFSTFRDKLVALYSKFCYRNIAKNALKIVTVSRFSKNRIAQRFKVSENKIFITGSSWDHFKTIEADNSILDKISVKPKEYFFTLGSLSKRKNLVWIADYAKNHSDDIFVISGKAISGLVPPELEILKNLKNVILVGYVTDSQIKALMKNCLAFVFPSYYEGFGLPPLEALSCGAKVVCSNAASIPEICSSCVNYIDPKNTNCDLKKIIENPVSPADEILEKYTYKNAAKKLYEIIKDFC